MSWDVWELPGASHAVDEILNAVHGGACVVAHLPAGAPRGLAQELRRRALEAGVVVWRSVNLEEYVGSEPLVVLGEELGAQASSPEDLAASMALDGTAAWVHGANAMDWLSWGPFLERFARSARAHTAGRCGALGITLEGPITTSPVRTDAGLQLVRWRGRLSRLDVQLYLAMCTPQPARACLEHQLRIRIATELGGPDVEFALLLARRSLRELLDPVPLLRAEAAARGWSGAPGPDAWAEGRVDDLDGRSFEHSASLAARGETEPISQRLWRAELAVIFPELEERRVTLVQQLKPFLRPMDTVFGPIDRVEDLELAHILYQVRGARVSAQTRSTLHHLNELRKSLAHLEPVRPQDLVGSRLVDAGLLAGTTAA